MSTLRRITISGSDKAMTDIMDEAFGALGRAVGRGDREEIGNIEAGQHIGTGSHLVLVGNRTDKNRHLDHGVPDLSGGGFRQRAIRAKSGGSKPRKAAESNGLRLFCFRACSSGFWTDKQGVPGHDVAGGIAEKIVDAVEAQAETFQIGFHEEDRSHHAAL